MSEQGLDWFFVATKVCDSETSDLATPLGFLEYLEFIGRRGGAGGHRGGHNPPRCAWGPRCALVGCAPSGHPPGASVAHLVSSGPKNPQEVSRHLDSV